MQKVYPQSRVEIDGFAARYYDTLLDMASLGRYFSFVKKAVELMRINPEDKILDLGTGTGRNACLMMRYLSSKGELIGIDTSEEMIAKFKKKCGSFPNSKIIKARVDKPLPFGKNFDKVFISFVLHGFPQSVRESIIENVHKVLKDDGNFFVLDYNEFSYFKMPFYLRIPFKIIECGYAFDFIKKDWKGILNRRGFGNFKEHLFFNSYIRLLKSTKLEVN